MEKFKAVPEAKKKINLLLKKLNLKPEKRVAWFIKNKKHLYSTKCIDKNGRVVFIKAVLNDEERFFTGLKNEALTLKCFNDNENNQGIKVPRFLNADFASSPVWFMHEFVPGTIIGRFYDLFRTSTKYIDPLVANLIALHKISSACIKKIKTIETIESQEYKRIIRDHQKNSPRLKKLINFEDILKLFDKNGAVLNEAPMVLTHGDFSFANQIVSRGQIYLIDWEWVRLDNFCVDLAHLWVQSWRYPKWQENLVASYRRHLDKKTDKIFEQNFDLMVINQALNELRWNVEICPKIYKKKATRFCLDAIKTILENKRLIN